MIDNSQPAFLRRLRGELTSGDSARHEQPVARNKRLKQDDEDDAPTYVLEDTKESLTKEEYEALVSGKDSSKAKDRQDDETTNTELPEDKTKSKDKIAEVGAASKKRKVAKIIGDEQDASKDSTTGAKGSKKAKKKAKAVKLTFGDEE